MMKRIPYLVLILSAVTAGHADVQVGQTEFHGWQAAYEITNGTVRVVVVPQIGRIMHYGFVDGDNVLWNNPALLGQVLPAQGPPQGEGGPEWMNFGGDKVWPNEQADFEAINGRAWPPDHWFDGSAQVARVIDGGLRLTSPVSPANGARVTREIRLAPQGTRVTIAQHLEKVRAASRADLEPLRYTIWNVTQIRPPQLALMPLNPHSGLPLRFHPWSDLARQQFVVEGDVGLFTPHPTQSQKVGVDSDRWLAAIVDDVVIAEFYRRDATRHYPDGGLSAEVYTSADYTELELLSPLVRLETGQSLRFEIAWELHRLPATADTPQRRVAAAVDWLTTGR